MEATSSCLPITYEGFTDMAMKGDTIYIGRYLVCGADSGEYACLARHNGAPSQDIA